MFGKAKNRRTKVSTRLISVVEMAAKGGRLCQVRVFCKLSAGLRDSGTRMAEGARLLHSISRGGGANRAAPALSQRYSDRPCAGALSLSPWSAVWHDSSDACMYVCGCAGCFLCDARRFAAYVYIHTHTHSTTNTNAARWQKKCTTAGVSMSNE